MHSPVHTSLNAIRLTVITLAAAMFTANAGYAGDQSPATQPAEPTTQAAEAPATQPAGKNHGQISSVVGATDPDGDTPGRLVGWLSLDTTLREGPVPFAWVSEADAGPSLAGVIDKLHTVADKARYQGVVVSVDQPKLKLNHIEALHGAFKQIQKAGKKVLVFAKAYDLRTYYLASAADQIILQRGGQVQLSGIGMEEMYVAGMLDKIGVQADLMQIGKFKGARDNFTRKSPSDAWNSNIDGLLDGLYGHIINTMADNRGLSKNKMEKLMRQSWSMSQKDYIKSPLIDRMANRDMINVTEAAFGSSFRWDQAMGQTQSRQEISGPFALFRMLMQKPQIKTDDETIAVLYGQGPIVSGRSSRGQGMFAAKTIGSRTMVKALKRIRRDPDIKGAIVRIDSPGGSALASEIVWQALRRTANKKPVFVSLGNTAASGGYYIASAGDRIYAGPTSIVGSIGVVGGKLAMGGLYEKIGINVTQRNRGPMAGAFNSAKPFTQKQRKAVRASLKQVYQQFLDRVHVGRGSRIDEIEKVAKGRVFTGKQAARNGLVDNVGGLNVTLRALQKKLGLEKGDYDVLQLPAPMSFQAFLNRTFGPKAHLSGASGIGQTIAAARKMLGQKRWDAVAPVLTGLMQLRDENALTLMPAALVIE
jgi:protease-4